MRAHFVEHGVQTQRNYLPALLSKYRARGIVEPVGYGRYRVNREHPELLG